MKLLITSLLIAFTSLTIQAQPMSNQAIDELVANTMETFDVPGIAVAVLKDGETILMKGYGVRSLDTKIPMDEKTLFGIASNSKAFTAAGLGILKQEGKLDWDDRVIDYIPEFRLYNPYVTDDFRIRDLLCHRSGMGLGAGDLMIWPDGTDFTRKDVINNLKYLKQVSPFRTKYDYDNLLYIVAGEIITKVSGMSWEEFIKEKILNPLGMKKSGASYLRLDDTSNVIAPHARVEGKVRVVSRTTNELMNAAGGIYSSVEDMGKWARYLLGVGADSHTSSVGADSPMSPVRTDSRIGPYIISAQTIKELWTPQTIIPVRNPGSYNTHFAAYGLGFRLADEKGYKVISHTGGLAGMLTKMTMIPELDLAIIVFTNQQSGAAFSAITNQIKDGYYGIKGVDWVERYASATSGSSANAQKIVEKVYAQIQHNDNQGLVIPDLPVPMKSGIRDLPGTYTDPWLGNITISQKGDMLYFLAERSPGLNGEIFWYKGNTFVVKWKDRSMDADAFILFKLDYEGHPTGFKMKAISPLTDFSFDFHDLNFKKIN
ncbi:MAG: serine hydrolase [Bacteroidota bacterium]|nr:serine hydrolase [Bacteroidota bacterium]